MSTTLTHHPGTTTYKLSQRTLFVTFVFSLAFIALHIIRPGNQFYAGLLAVLITVNIGALAWCKRSPGIAFQFYWWVALFVIMAMTVIDARSGASDFPFVVAIPTIATHWIKRIVSVKAASFYGLGAVALAIPTGIAYNNIGQAGVLVGMVVLALVLRGEVSEGETCAATDPITELCVDFCETLKQIHDNHTAGRE